MSKKRKLPEMEVKGADVTIGKGRVVVTKKRTPRPYTGNVSQMVHQSQSSFGKSFVRVTKDNAVHLHIAGTTTSMKNRHDIIPFVINPNNPMMDCIKTAGFSDDDVFVVKVFLLEYVNAWVWFVGNGCALAVVSLTALYQVQALLFLFCHAD